MEKITSRENAKINHVVSDKQFGGITGDLAGWFLQKAELWMLAALCACQWGGLL